MSELLFKKSRLAPFVAMGASALALTGCVAANIGNTSSFVFGCSPETPSPKISKPSYKSLPSDRGKVRVEFLCVNNETGEIAAPLRVDAGSKPFTAKVHGEREYEFDVSYGVNIEANDPQPVLSTDPANPANQIVDIKGGIVNFEGVTSPALVSISN